MKRGFALPVSGSWATPANIVHVARRAEELGYESLWTFQRLLSPVDASWGEMYRGVLDPTVVLGYAAAVTTRVRLGVAVLNMPFVSPVLRRQAGRHAGRPLRRPARPRPRHGLVGGGVRRHRRDQAAPGAPVGGLHRRPPCTVDAGRRSSTRASSTRSRRRRPIRKPVQRPHPPILLGGTAPAALRRAGRLTDGWVSSSRADLSRIDESIDIVRAAAAEAGRDPAALRFVCRGVVRVREQSGDRSPLQGSLEQIRGDLRGPGRHRADRGVRRPELRPRGRLARRRPGGQHGAGRGGAHRPGAREAPTAPGVRCPCIRRAGRSGGRRAGPRRPRRAGAGAARPPCRSRTRRATSSTGRSVVSSSSRACSTRCRVSHAPGREPGLLAEPPGERAHAHPRLAGHRGQVDRLAEPAQRPLPGRPGRRAGRRRQRGHDELGLPTVAPRRHDAAAGGVVGHLAAVVAAHDVQAQVDAGPDAGRGEHVAVVDEEHVRVEPHLREVAGGTGRRTPSGSSPGRPSSRPSGGERRTPRCRSRPAGSAARQPARGPPPRPG